MCVRAVAAPTRPVREELGGCRAPSCVRRCALLVAPLRPLCVGLLGARCGMSLEVGVCPRAARASTAPFRTVFLAGLHASVGAMS